MKLQSIFGLPMLEIGKVVCSDLNTCKVEITKECYHNYEETLKRTNEVYISHKNGLVLCNIKNVSTSKNAEGQIIVTLLLDLVSLRQNEESRFVYLSSLLLMPDSTAHLWNRDNRYCGC